MKARTAESFATRLLLPRLPGFTAKGRLIYRRPLVDLLCGCYFEDSSFDKNNFTISAFVLPLHVPTEHLHFTFGKRLGRGSGTWWDYTKERESELGRTVLSAIQAEALPMLDRFRDARDFFERGMSLVSDTRGVHLLEARAYSAFRAELLTDGKGLLGALEDRLDEMDQSLLYVGAMRERAKELRNAAEAGMGPLQALLDTWKEETLSRLGLAE